MILLTAGSLFLYNLLCGLSPCNPTLKPPEARVKKMASPESYNNNQLTDLSPVVTTSLGALEGYMMLTTEGRKVYAFEGIKYGEALPFQPPKPTKSWLGIRKVKKLGSECLQLNPAKLMMIVGASDCLFMNVYTRKLPDFTDTKGENLLPVIFAIHGGSYYYGHGGDIGPAYLLNHEVILVTFNYRLGVMGFMSAGTNTSSPGNCGLKDQALALKFVHDNIHFFGGDKNRITVMGQSTGAASAHFLSMSPLTRDLFQSGVSLSGSAFTHWAYDNAESAKRVTDKMAGIVGCSTYDREAMMTCFKKKNPVALVSGQFRLFDWAPFPFPITLFAPVIENKGPDAFISETPQQFYDRANSTRTPLKPWIFGKTSEEGYLGVLFLQVLFGETSLRRRWSELAPAFLDFKHTATNPSGLANLLAKLYFGDKFTPQTVPTPYIAQLFGDRLFLHGVYKAIALHSPLAPTYSYLFQYKGKHNVENMYGFQKYEWGVGHSEDLYYYFNSTMYYPGFERSDKEYQLTHVMTTLLKNFAAKGYPSMTVDSGKDLNVWDPINPRSPKVLRIDKDIKMIPQPMLERYYLWDSFPPQIKKDLNLQ